MSHPPAYTRFHPRWYRQRMSTYWWLRSGAYLQFILRELSCLFIAWWIAVTLAQVAALGQSASAYVAFEAWMRKPLVLLLNFVSLLFVLYHAVTWFNLAPKAMVVHVRGRPLPGWWIAGANYAAWLGASLVVTWFLLGR